MWCPACQQDVPAVAVPEEPGVVRCTFCGDGLTAMIRGQEEQSQVQRLTANVFDSTDSGSGRVSDNSEAAGQRLHSPRPGILDDWDLEPDLRAAERLVSSLRNMAPTASVLSTSDSHLEPPNWVPLPSEEPQRRKEAPREKSGTLAWTFLSLGVMALACGGVLIVWSLAADRSDLWSLGLPLAVVGQGGVVIGLLLQLEGLWQSSKRTEKTLDQLDGKLHELAHTTTMLGTTHSTPAQSFYVHMAEGASPQLLLADLKGQLDLLAQQMARRS